MILFSVLAFVTTLVMGPVEELDFLSPYRDTVKKAVAPYVQAFLSYGTGDAAQPRQGESQNP